MTSLLRVLVLLAALGALAEIVTGKVSAQEFSAPELMTRANLSYERGEYQEAAHQYEALIERGYRDTAIYFNLGNAYLESGDLGRSILSYLRARELSPRDQKIKENLELASGMTVDRIESERDSLVEGLSYIAYGWLTRNELGAIALLLWTLSGIAIGSLMAWRVFLLRRAVNAIAVFLTIITLGSFVMLLSMVYADPNDSTGVVTADSVEIVSGPGPQYAASFTLHAGAQVRLTDSRHGWLRIALPGGELRGWVPTHAIEAVGWIGDG